MPDIVQAGFFLACVLIIALLVAVRKLHMSSTNVMIKRVSGLLGTKDLNPWEQNFVQNICDTSKQATRPDLLSPKQVEHLEKIFNKHFSA